MLLNNPLSLITYPANSMFADRFRDIDRLFSYLTGHESLRMSPDYDIRKHDENRYSITVSVPGFREEELDISAHSGQIVIEGKCGARKENGNSEEIWLHRGISRENFSLTLSLCSTMKIQCARLEQGLLVIELKKEIQENEEIKKIAIGGRGSNEPNNTR